MKPILYILSMVAALIVGAIVAIAQLIFQCCALAVVLFCLLVDMTLTQLRSKS